MQQYKLLRDNKETGPYGWQELVELGLKAHDLVWADGKSASWKYPAEIEEFRNYAPAVTDDLYVQFHTPPSQASAEKKPRSVQNIPQTRYVTVILPARTAIAEVRQNAPSLHSVLMENGTDSYLPESQYYTGASSYTFSQLHKKSYLASLTAAFLILISGGVFFGTYKKAFLAERTDPVNVKVQVPGIEPAPAPAESSVDEPAIIQLISKNDAAPVVARPRKSIDPVPSLPPNPSLRFASLRRYIDVKATGFSVGFFGGITGLSLRVSNNGSEQLQNVVIAVDFLKRNRQLHHSEYITIPVLNANSTITLSIPETNRGTAFQTRITGINGILSK
ncbi:hypothetical protein [Flavihumibacter solisilvae]|uniref:GYF domain-containing protein n=1 Tax=Flavihumibacter solisilvae TaxID=1349421 RepID=A0A0C1L181_9BACT|nr:hypothetical protein [Flavihumibacter solisilvae]KIC93782.1 hypothetical protein OI18_15550 [Flavihumibacter solisilvae]